jgi:hypothetical protein
MQKKKKALSEITESKPIQLELFELDDYNLNNYSNTIELYDVMPKYYFGGVKREKGQFTESLPIISRDFSHRGKNYKLNISPASIVDKKSGKTISHYPSQREELVEDVLRKLAAKQQGVFLDDEVGVKFTLYEVQTELVKIGHGYNVSEIKEAIEICSRSVVEISSRDGNEVSYVSNIFPFVAMETKDPDRADNKVVVMFHPLVTKSINEGTYRLINYEKLMRMKMPLSRWLHKRISHLFSQATIHNPYSIKLSTIVRDSGMKEYKTISERIRQVSKAINELIKHDILSKFEIEKETEKNKILDAMFFLYVSDTFVADIKKANRVSNLKLESEKQSDIEELDLIELRKEMEKSVYGLSKTIINNVIGKISTKEEKKEVMLALEAAKEYIEEKEEKGDVNAGALTLSAIRNKYIPKSINKRKAVNKDNYKKPEIQNLIKEEKVDRDKLWKKFLINLERKIGKRDFDKWFKEIKLNSSYKSEIVIEFPTKLLRDWVKREYNEAIKNIWNELDGLVKNVVILATEKN